MNQHPELADLALYSGRELPLLKRWSVGRHLAQCSASRVSFVSISTEGTAETRYTDAETGQITVNHVYLD